MSDPNLEPDHKLQIVNQAIADRREGVLSARAGDVTHRIGVRLACEERAEEQPGFWARILEGQSQILTNLIQTGSTIELSFRTEKESVFFDTVPLRERRKLFSHRVLLKNPEKITIIERRKDSRETVADEILIGARLRRADDSATWEARLWDLSPTGASFLCGANPAPPRLELDTPLSITLTHHGVERKLTACHRYTQPLSSTTVRMGVQFQLAGASDPNSAPWFLEMLEQLRGRRIRDTFRHALRKGFHITPSWDA